MATIFKLATIKRKMKSKPKGQRLNNFFNGAYEDLTPAQRQQVEAIIDKEYLETKKMFTEAKTV